MSTNLKKSGAALYVDALPRMGPTTFQKGNAAENVGSRKQTRPRKRQEQEPHIKKPLLAKEFPEMKIPELNIKLGEKWRSMSSAEKKPFINEAEQIRLQHQEDPSAFAKKAAKKVDSPKEKIPRKKEERVPRIKRPTNSFMIWAKINRPLLAKEYPEINNAGLSIKLGEKWQSMNSAEKQPFVDEADRLKRQHQEDHPDWEYKPTRKKRKLGDIGKSLFFEVTKNSQGKYVTRDATEPLLQILAAHSLLNETSNNMRHISSNPTDGKGPFVLKDPFMLPPDILASGVVKMAEFSPITTFQDQELVEITTDAEDWKNRTKPKKRKSRSFRNQLAETTSTPPKST